MEFSWSILRLFDEIVHHCFEILFLSSANIDKIDSIGPNYIKMKDKEIPLSESSRKELMQQIETL